MGRPWRAERAGIRTRLIHDVRCPTGGTGGPQGRPYRKTAASRAARTRNTAALRTARARILVGLVAELTRFVAPRRGAVDRLPTNAFTVLELDGQRLLGWQRCACRAASRVRAQRCAPCRRRRLSTSGPSVLLRKVVFAPCTRQHGLAAAAAGRRELACATVFPARRRRTAGSSVVVSGCRNPPSRWRPAHPFPGQAIVGAAAICSVNLSDAPSCGCTGWRQPLDGPLRAERRRRRLHGDVNGRRRRLVESVADAVGERCPSPAKPRRRRVGHGRRVARRQAERAGACWRSRRACRARAA